MLTAAGHLNQSRESDQSSWNLMTNCPGPHVALLLMWQSLKAVGLVSGRYRSKAIRHVKLNGAAADNS